MGWKDFYDIWLMMRQFNFSGLDLAEALKRTFGHRKTDGHYSMRKYIMRNQIARRFGKHS